MHHVVLEFSSGKNLEDYYKHMTLEMRQYLELKMQL